jgi:hypothetical protein
MHLEVKPTTAEGVIRPGATAEIGVEVGLSGEAMDAYRNDRDHPTLKAIRAAEFSGKCGVCEFADLCGGSRARAYASSGDPLGEDTACPYVPSVVGTPEPLVAAGA